MFTCEQISNMSPSKKPSLAAAMQEASGKKPVADREEVTSEEATTARDTPPSRRGKKAVTGHFDPAVPRQLKQLALDNDSSVQALLAEALNDLFVKYGRKPIT